MMIMFLVLGVTLIGAWAIGQATASNTRKRMAEQQEAMRLHMAQQAQQKDDI
jgi:hypothetical protein